MSASPIVRSPVSIGQIAFLPRGWPGLARPGPARPCPSPYGMKCGQLRVAVVVKLLRLANWGTDKRTQCARAPSGHTLAPPRSRFSPRFRPPRRPNRTPLWRAWSRARPAQFRWRAWHISFGDVPWQTRRRRRRPSPSSAESTGRTAGAAGSQTLVSPVFALTLSPSGRSRSSSRPLGWRNLWPTDGARQFRKVS